MQVIFSVHRIYSTPTVLPLDASPELFSEARALSTVRDLTETIGIRLVSLLHNLLRSLPGTAGPAVVCDQQLPVTRVPLSHLLMLELQAAFGEKLFHLRYARP